MNLFLLKLYLFYRQYLHIFYVIYFTICLLSMGLMYMGIPVVYAQSPEPESTDLVDSEAAVDPIAAPAPAPEGRIEDDLVYIETNRLITQVRPTGLSVESQSSFVAKEMRESILNSNDPSISWDDSSREAVKTALQDAGMYYSDTGTQNNSALSDLRSSDEEWSSSSADDEHSESDAVGIEDLDWGSASPEQAPDSEHFDSEAAAPEQAADSESNVPQTGNKRSLSESDLESRSSPKKSKRDE